MTFIPEPAAQILRLGAIPLSSALAGWAAITLAVRLLFRPRRPRRVLRLTIQGLLPARREELARAAAELVARNLPAPADLTAMLERPDIQASLDEAIRERIRDFLDNKLKALNPMIAMMLGGALRDKIEELLVREMRRTLPEMSAKLMEKMGGMVDVRQIVEDKVRAMDFEELERTVQTLAGRELRLLALLAGALGFALGLVPALLLWI